MEDEGGIVDEYKIEMKKVKIYVPMDDIDRSKWITSFSAIMPWALEVLMSIWMLCYLVKLIIKVRRGEIFTGEIVKYFKEIRNTYVLNISIGKTLWDLYERNSLAPHPLGQLRGGVHERGKQHVDHHWICAFRYL